MKVLREFEPAGESARQSAGEEQGRRAESYQQQVWDSVRGAQMMLKRSLGAEVADERSPSSLQLTLENKVLASVVEKFDVNLGKLPQEHPDAVGYVFAINGRINGGDEFGSAGLFRKLWRRQLAAASTEAIANENTSMRKQPTLAGVAAFLDDARSAAWFGKPMPGGMSLEVRETDRALYTEIRHPNGSWVHRSFVAYH